MRRPFVAGNWKMNLDRANSVALAMAVCKDAGALKDVDIAVCPASVYLHAVSGVTAGTNVGLGGQNMHHEAGGAFTGEISAAMLLDVGCRYVILGHSERRHLLGETDGQINLKVHAALKAGLIPILCVGELLAEREANQTGAVIRKQCEGSLAGVSPEQIAKLVIAYEPVWAIGTGKVASPAQAEEVHLDLRKILAARYTPQIADGIRIQYGGSVKPDNAAELMAQPNVDGALVGGASLKADDFLKIAAAAKTK